MGPSEQIRTQQNCSVELGFIRGRILGEFPTGRVPKIRNLMAKRTFAESPVCPHLASLYRPMRLTESDPLMTANDIIRKLNLQPHPEGGWYRQTWVDETSDGRPTGTCIYFLLKAGESSHWHRVDAVEIWHYYSGAPLILSMSESDHGPRQDHILGPNLESGQHPQLIVPKHHWQAAKTEANSSADYTLVGCTVSPGFQFEGFHLAAPGFTIG